MYFGELGKRVATPVYWRDALPAGFRGRGPAIIETPGSTVVVHPADQVSIDDYGNVHIRLPQGGAAA